MKYSLKQKLIKYNIKINILNGIAAIISLNLVKPYYAKFAERLGANDYQIALLSSLPALITVFTLIPGAILIERSSDKKSITGFIMFLQKIFYILIALIPFINSSYQSWMFVILIGIMNFPYSIALIGYQDSIGDIFNEEERGMAMGLRNTYSTIFSIITIFLSGILLTKLPKTNKETIILYQIFFLIAFISGLGEVFSYLKFKGMKKGERKHSSEYMNVLKQIIKNLPKEKDFIMFTICSLLFHFGWQMGWPLFSIYSINYLNASEFWLSAISISSGISSVLTYTLWAKFANKKGNSLALSVATFGMGVTPVLYAISRNISSLVVFNIIVGISVAGTTLILFNILLDVTPHENRTIYIAIYNTLINISAAISPIVGVALKNKFNIYIALIIAAAIRFLGSFAFFIYHKEP